MNGDTPRRDIVLVVDDSPDSLGFLTAALERTGITALVGIDGPTALELLKNVTPDLVLMDAVMPGMDGFEVCRRMKASKETAHIPVIFMTGLSETQHVVEGLRAGGVDYVTKPIVIDELLARIGVHLANARVAHGTSAALDATGRFLVATDEGGKLIWATLQAESLLRSAFPERDIRGDGLPEGLTQQLASFLATARQQHAAAQDITVKGEKQLTAAYVGSVDRNEHLFRLTEADDDQQNNLLRTQFLLTQREAEVLLWLARGKSNRDIAEILGISPRTVNKHVEQVFNKLDVDNRASATAHATKVLALHA